MNKRLTGLAVIMIFMALAIGAKAQDASINNVTASASIVAPISISEGTEGLVLDFGSMAVGSSGGTCVLSPSNQKRSVTGDVSLVGDTYSCAGFKVDGISGDAYTITLPSTDITLTGDDGSSTMTVSGITAYVASSGAVGTSGTITGGTDTFVIGGTLHVGADQTMGTYTSDNFTITVAYQ